MGLKFTSGGAVPPCTPPSGIFFVPEASTLICPMEFFYLNFLALLLSEILGGPKFTLGGLTPPGRRLAEKFVYPKRVLQNI